MQRLSVSPGYALHLPTGAGLPEQVHVFSLPEITAIEAALAARRALLIRGEPGTGKSQLAYAAAVALKRAFISFVVDARTEARDLLWHFDAVARLAEAQIQGTLISGAEARGTVREKLEVGNFIHPRPLWWAFDWDGALGQAKRAGISPPVVAPDCDSANGVVVLIDEIDKADAEVPNGLLEALGAGEFAVHGTREVVRPPDEAVPPLVILTTNEERTLPDAFLRRCLVLRLELPQTREELIKHLVARGAAHFPDLEPGLLQEAAGMVAADRDRAREQGWRPLPGQAEFIDLIRAVRELAPGDREGQVAQLGRIAEFVLRKHPGSFG